MEAYSNIWRKTEYQRRRNDNKSYAKLLLDLIWCEIENNSNKLVFNLEMQIEPIKVRGEKNVSYDQYFSTLL